MIPLKTSVPYTNNKKPKLCSEPLSGLKTSHPRNKDMIQMPKVRHVSIVLRAVALIARVTARPHPLKREIERAIATDVQMIVGDETIWWKPVGMSKYPPRPEGVEPMKRCRKGMEKRTVKKPQRPS